MEPRVSHRVPELLAIACGLAAMTAIALAVAVLVTGGLQARNWPSTCDEAGAEAISRGLVPEAMTSRWTWTPRVGLVCEVPSNDARIPPVVQEPPLWMTAAWWGAAGAGVGAVVIGATWATVSVRRRREI